MSCHCSHCTTQLCVHYGRCSSKIYSITSHCFPGPPNIVYKFLARPHSYEVLVMVLEDYDPSRSPISHDVMYLPFLVYMVRCFGWNVPLWVDPLPPSRHVPFLHMEYLNSPKPTDLCTKGLPSLCVSQDQLHGRKCIAGHGQMSSLG